MSQLQSPTMHFRTKAKSRNVKVCGLLARPTALGTLNSQGHVLALGVLTTVVLQAQTSNHR